MTELSLVSGSDGVELPTVAAAVTVEPEAAETVASNENTAVPLTATVLPRAQV